MVFFRTSARTGLTCTTRGATGSFLPQVLVLQRLLLLGIADGKLHSLLTRYASDFIWPRTWLAVFRSARAESVGSRHAPQDRRHQAAAVPLLQRNLAFRCSIAAADMTLEAGQGYALTLFESEAGWSETITVSHLAAMKKQEGLARKGAMRLGFAIQGVV